MIAVLRHATYGERGWELAGKGAAAFIGASVLGELLVGDGSLRWWNPVHVIIGGALIWGLIAFGVGLAREARRARAKLTDDAARTNAAPTSSAQTAAPVPEVPIPADEVRSDAPPHDYSGGEARPEDGYITNGVPAPASALRGLLNRNERGLAAEDDAADVLAQLDPARYRVTRDVSFKKEEIAQPVGNLDFVVERADGERAVTVEVKTTVPWARQDNGTAWAAEFAGQAARQSAALYRASGGAVKVKPIVVYVPARDGTVGESLAAKIRGLECRKRQVGRIPVHSVGLSGLNELVEELLR